MPKVLELQFQQQSNKYLGRFLLRLTGLISLVYKGLSRVFFSTTVRKHQFFITQSSLQYNCHIHLYITIGKTVALVRQNFVSKVMSLPFNKLSRLVIAFLPRIYPLSILFSSVQFISVAQSCPTHCDPMKGSTPGLPVHHQLPEFTQTHIHRVSDAIQPSHPLSSPFPPAPNPSQH